MAKNIVLCSDGTGNRGGKLRSTNVWRIFKAVDVATLDDSEFPKQIAFHDDGVGTESNRVTRILGGAIGFGLTRNVRELYESLCRVYRPGDHVFLFGFSRGAYTIRIVGGMVAKFGVVNPRSEGLTERAFQAKIALAHKAVLRASVPKDIEDQLHVASHENSRQVRFIGVWDTVDAVGMPVDGLASLLNKIHRFRFSDNFLDPERVNKACHVLSIDDQRRTFHPVLWNETNRADAARDDWIEQVWFAGVHANVGGSYPKDELAYVSLQWMMHHAAAEGLAFHEAIIKEADRERNPHGKLYDSRAGLAMAYRYAPRNIGSICRREGADVRLHYSVLRRLSVGAADYAPINIPDSYDISAEGGTAPKERNAIQRQYIQQRALDFVYLRELLYWLFMPSLLIFLLLGCRILDTGDKPYTFPADAISWAINGMRPLVPNFMEFWVDTYEHNPFVFAGFMIWFVAIFFVGRKLKRTIHSHGRQAWLQAFAPVGTKKVEAERARVPIAGKLRDSWLGRLFAARNRWR